MVPNIVPFASDIFLHACVNIFYLRKKNFSFSIMKQAYLNVLRTLKRTCVNDRSAERQIVAAIRTSISDLVNQRVSESDISKELDMTEQMLRVNIAQVSYDEKIDSYAFKVTEEMVPSPGSVVEISTPGDLLGQSHDLAEISGLHKVSQKCRV